MVPFYLSRLCSSKPSLSFSPSLHLSILGFLIILNPSSPRCCFVPQDLRAFSSFLFFSLLFSSLRGSSHSFVSVFRLVGGVFGRASDRVCLKSKPLLIALWYSQGAYCAERASQPHCYHCNYIHCFLFLISSPGSIVWLFYVAETQPGSNFISYIQIFFPSIIIFWPTW